MGYPFIQAKWFTPTNGRVIRGVCIHTMEAPDKPDTAESVAKWMSSLPENRKASAHYFIDSDSIVQGVLDKDIAYGAPGANHDFLHLEHAGYAAQTDADWMSVYNRMMLERSAYLTAQLCLKYGIPVVWLSQYDLAEGKRGITSHANVTLWQQSLNKPGSHTDPGPAFPVAYYLQRVDVHMEQLKLIVNGKTVEADVRLEDNSVVGKLRPVVEALGATITYDATTGVVTITGGSK